MLKNRLYKKGGGVICYVKYTLPAMKKKKKKKKQDSDKYDSVFIELETNKRNKLAIGTVYRPPKQQATDDAALYEKP